MVDRNTLVKEISALQDAYKRDASVHTYYVGLMNRVLYHPDKVTLNEILHMCDSALIMNGVNNRTMIWLRKFKEYQKSCE